MTDALPASPQFRAARQRRPTIQGGACSATRADGRRAAGAALTAGQVVSRAATLSLGVWEEAGQAGTVTAVAASPDGNWIASGSDDATVKLWRTSDHGLECTLAQTGLLGVTALAFGPAGTNILAAGYYDGSIRLWNTANGALVGSFTNCYGKITSLSFSPNGQQLAIGCGDWITRILGLSSGAILNGSGRGSI